jgi:hypothetical protein
MPFVCHIHHQVQEQKSVNLSNLNQTIMRSLIIKAVSQLDVLRESKQAVTYLSTADVNCAIA